MLLERNFVFVGCLLYKYVRKGFFQYILSTANSNIRWCMYSPSSLCCVELHSKSHKAYGENEVGSQHLRTLLVTLLRKDKNPVKGSITLSHTVNGEET